MLWLNFSAFVVTAIAAGYLFFVVSRTAKELKKGFLFLALGVFISLSIHSFAEFLESVGLMNVKILVNVMPPLVLVGSVLLLIGSIQIYRVIKLVGKRR